MAAGERSSMTGAAVQVDGRMHTHPSMHIHQD
jgi:hypothetical protein